MQNNYQKLYLAMLAAGLLSACVATSSSPASTYTISGVTINNYPLTESQDYTYQTNGPRYSVFLLQNNSQATVTPVISFSTHTLEAVSGASYTPSGYLNCQDLNNNRAQLSVTESCLYVVRLTDNEFNSHSLGITSAIITLNATSANGGVSPSVSYTAEISGNLYLGGSFSTTYDESTTLNYIAAWNGQNYTAVGPGFNDSVFAIVEDRAGNIYAGGVFSYDSNESQQFNYLAKYNGSSWSAVESGFDNRIYALAVDNQNNLYVGGEFDSLYNGTPNSYNAIARWDGSNWDSMESGFTPDFYASVDSLAIDSNGNIYAGGYFESSANGVTLNNIAKWNGSSWESLAPGGNAGLTNGSVLFSLAIDNSNNVYLGGYFTTASDGTLLNDIALWNGSNWQQLGSGPGFISTMNFSSSVSALVLDSSQNIYAGGFYDATPDSESYTLNNISLYTNSIWNPVGSAPGLNSSVLGLAIAANGNLYAVGEFDAVYNGNANSLNYVAMYDGTNWNALGTGLNQGSLALSFAKTMTITPNN